MDPFGYRKSLNPTRQASSTSAVKSPTFTREGSLRAHPFRPIPSGELPGDPASRFLRIRPAEMLILSRHGQTSVFESDSSAVVMARLRQAARDGDRVLRFAHGPGVATADSLAALNCYLRTGRAMGRFLLPFDRLLHVGTENDRWAWSQFGEYLGLEFA